MGWWNKHRNNSILLRKEGDENWNAFLEVRKAQLEWERAYMMFDEALGQDQIDYAIYILEAAERRYQIHLKHAKLLGLNRSHIQG